MRRLSEQGRNLLLAGAVAGIGVLGLASTLVDMDRKQVTVTVDQINDVAQVFVNCEQAGGVLHQGDRVELGLLRLDDLVTMQARNVDGNYDASFRVLVKGYPPLRYDAPSSSNGGVSKRHGVAFARTLTASRREIGRIGCFQAHPAMKLAMTEGRFDAGIWGTLPLTVLVDIRGALLVLLVLIVVYMLHSAGVFTRPALWKEQADLIPLVTLAAGLSLDPRLSSAAILGLSALIFVVVRMRALLRCAGERSPGSGPPAR